MNNTSLKGQRTAYRSCPICEATCGLEITLEGDSIAGIRGDDQDVFSRGFICPKGVALKQLHEDPDRIRQPLVKRNGQFDPVSWTEAFEVITRRLPELIKTHGRDSTAVYLGNPTIHTMAGALYVRPLIKALGTKNLYSASTVDQMPKQVSCGFLFGSAASIPVPDIDRTDYLLILGANPLVSNGSLCTAPNFPGRLKALKKRGGRLVVVDPIKTRTAQEAHEHLFIRPGADPYLLFALVHTLFNEGRVAPGHLADHLAGLDLLEEMARPFSPEAVAEICRIEPAVIRRLARELAEAPTAAVYGRIGTCTAPFGALTSWLVDVLNILTGNLDRPGGAMFPQAAHSRLKKTPGGRGFNIGRWTSRVKGLAEVCGELPIATLADEIETPGTGQVRSLITIAGNPVLTTPNGRRLAKALDSLDFMVAVDFYLNETTRHADVILPAPSPLYQGQYDFAFYNLSVRNIAHYSPPVLNLPPEKMHLWQILGRLTLIAAGQGPGFDLNAFDDFILGEMIASEMKRSDSPWSGLDQAGIMSQFAGIQGPERLLEAMLRLGPYGTSSTEALLTLEALSNAPHGIDFGALQPCLPEILRTPSAKIELCAEPIQQDIGRLQAGLTAAPEGLVLIGRRHLRSNNSWLHNLPSLVTGPERCTMLVNPKDAARLGLEDGGPAKVSSRVGSIELTVTFTEEIMPGVVSIPHGWGHDLPGAALAVAAERPGVNSNLLTDETLLDPLSGTSVLNGIPVQVEPVTSGTQDQPTLKAVG
jgi:anaerobic selenocysteine-containing dehydrogenase